MKHNLLTLLILFTFTLNLSAVTYTVTSMEELEQASELLKPGERYRDYKTRRLVDRSLPSLRISEFEEAHRMQGRDRNGEPLQTDPEDSPEVTRAKERISKFARLNDLADPYDDTQQQLQVGFAMNKRHRDRQDLDKQMDQLVAQLEHAEQLDQQEQLTRDDQVLVERINALESKLALAQTEQAPAIEPTVVDKMAYAGMGCGVAGLAAMGGMAYARRRNGIS